MIEAPLAASRVSSCSCSCSTCEFCEDAWATVKSQSHQTATFICCYGKLGVESTVSKAAASLFLWTIIARIECKGVYGLLLSQCALQAYNLLLESHYIPVSYGGPTSAREVLAAAKQGTLLLSYLDFAVTIFKSAIEPSPATAFARQATRAFDLLSSASRTAAAAWGISLNVNVVKAPEQLTHRMFASTLSSDCLALPL